jgi:plastocyanin
MKIITTQLAALFILFAGIVSAQVTQINLEQTKGQFTQESLELTPGEYQFNVSNSNVGHEVGFVLVPKGMYDQTKHIKEAYVKAPVADGKSSMTGVVNLEPGMYEYFCPLNPTPKYTVVVRDDVETIKLGQMSGKFVQESVTVKEGTYQFEIGNDGVGHDVGFVLVPQGMYDASKHIKAAYVTKPVADGTSGKTGIVELEAGTYEYFCPLNPTPKYTLTVTK